MSRLKDDKISPADFLAKQGKRRKSDRTQQLNNLLKFKFTAREAIQQMLENDINLTEISRASNVNQTVLRLHVFHKQAMSPKNAKRLERWSKGIISSVKMFLEDQVG